MYAKTDIEKVRKTVDMIKFLEDRGTTFRSAGITFLALCPLHSERSPSFNVRKGEFDTFRCFGCGQSGDIFSLVQELDSLSFSGAIQELAEYSGIELESVEEDEEYKHQQVLYKVMKTAADWYREQFLSLPNNHPAHQNLAKRNLLFPANEAGYGGLTDPIIGYAPGGGLTDYLLKERYQLNDIVEAGLAYKNERGHMDRFYNRLLWTIQDPSGRPIGFSGRKVLPEDEKNKEVAKYKNSPETPLYKKSSALLGLAWAKKEIAKTQKVYIVEGQTDVMALRAVGVDNVVASCGTAVGEAHIQILNRLSSAGRGAERFQIIFCFDGDAAGVKAAKNVFEKNKTIQLSSLVVRMEQYDPCDLRLNEGDAALQKVLSNTVSLIEFILEEEIKTWDTKTAEGRNGFLNRAQEILAQISNPNQRDYYVRKISLWTGSPVEEIQQALAGRPTRMENTAVPSREVATLQEKILGFGLQYPDVFEPVAQKAKLAPGMFMDSSLAEVVLTRAELDYAKPDITKLLHVDLQVEEGRAADIIKNMISSFYRLQYAEELNRINSIFGDLEYMAANGEDAAFERILNEQAAAKEKYLIKL